MYVLPAEEPGEPPAPRAIVAAVRHGGARRGAGGPSAPPWATAAAVGSRVGGEKGG